MPPGFSPLGTQPGFCEANASRPTCGQLGTYSDILLLENYFVQSMHTCMHAYTHRSIDDVGLNCFEILSQIHQKLSSVLNEAATPTNLRNRRTSTAVSRKQNPSTRIPINIVSHEPVSCLETTFISGILDKAFLSAGFLSQWLLVAMSPIEQGIMTSLVPFYSLCAIVVHGLTSLTLKSLHSDFHRPGLSVCLFVGRSAHRLASRWVGRQAQMYARGA